MQLVKRLFFFFTCHFLYYFFHYVIFIALSEKECEIWVKGLNYLLSITVKAPYPAQVQAWLRREFYSMENQRET